MAKESKPVPEQSAEQKDIEMRVKLFDKEFQGIQAKYKLKAVAQVVFPGGAVLSVPIQVFPFPAGTPVVPPQNNEASNPDA